MTTVVDDIVSALGYTGVEIDVAAKVREAVARVATLQHENTLLRTFYAEDVRKHALLTNKPVPTDKEVDAMIAERIEMRQKNWKYTVKVIATSSQERALKNIALVNTGMPFKGDYYIYTTTHDKPLRVQYSPSTAVGCMEVGMFNRLFHDLSLDKQYTLTFVANDPQPVKKCTLYVVGMNNVVVSDHFDSALLKDALSGQHIVLNRHFAVKAYGSTYKLTPTFVDDNDGIITKDTVITYTTDITNLQ